MAGIACQRCGEQLSYDDGTAHIPQCPLCLTFSTAMPKQALVRAADGREMPPKGISIGAQEAPTTYRSAAPGDSTVELSYRPSIDKAVLALFVIVLVLIPLQYDWGMCTSVALLLAAALGGYLAYQRFIERTVIELDRDQLTYRLMAQLRGRTLVHLLDFATPEQATYVAGQLENSLRLGEHD
jgi:hypothetical protein